ncbi:FAD-dependent oxidoreductase [Azotobacter chroococcum]|uniref:Succinate dehydrogenase/fumarate reductase flavoprotein subunit n=1 Tax=Azotobacter chroococcum TaxID=353 RepID=A0A4R1PQR6_9GAMM|nr:FAD-dependent oxidoreductase [Azotobacter chroococcum]TBV91764.1 FAD-dependent oxidoreductase [Azotobacter chroococcum]TCL32860.1 succinate dehydrogenase/fumarate reductase flavoprotein subunit [Azotobacter chroococcum]
MNTATHLSCTGPTDACAQTYDVIVLGSGAAGFAAAVSAACQGLKVLLVEKAATFGGTSAISGGAVWIHDSDQARAAGIHVPAEQTRTYLKGVIGKGYQPALIDAFIERGREALSFLERHSELKYSLRPLSPDYYPDLPGGTETGRALEIAEYDGRRLGTHFKDLRRPPDGMLLFGGMMVNRVDIQHFLGIKRSPKSLWHCLKLLARYGVDRLSHPRGTRLTVGNALIARLASTAFAKGVELWLNARTESLIVEDGRVKGMLIDYDGQRRRVLARGGVVLASGGFAAGPQAAAYRPETDTEHWSMSPETNVGDGLSLAAAVNAATGEGMAANFFWAPVSVLRKPDGSLERFPHLVTDRAKPGVIAVNRAGRRFVNESDSYHSFVEAMFADGGANAPCWLICDAEAMNRYGMGLARPRPVDNAALIEAGYLHRAESIAGLACSIGVDAAGLQRTLERYNADAREHVDREFGKGGNAYNRYMGDPLHQPNPCIAPLNKAPYYAIKIGTGDLGSARGLLTDARANVLDRAGQPVAGLYAAGNEMNSIMDGTYPGPGITLGPGLTFGYLAACDIAERLRNGKSNATQPGEEHVLRTAHLHH